MDFAKLRHKVVFLKPSTSEINEQSEQVIGWFPFHPVTKTASDDVYSTQDGEICFKSGVLSGLNIFRLRCSCICFACDRQRI